MYPPGGHGLRQSSGTCTRVRRRCRLRLTPIVPTGYGLRSLSPRRSLLSATRLAARRAGSSSPRHFPMRFQCSFIPLPRGGWPRAGGRPACRPRPSPGRDCHSVTSGGPRQRLHSAYFSGSARPSGSSSWFVPFALLPLNESGLSADVTSRRGRLVALRVLSSRPFCATLEAPHSAVTSPVG